MLPAASRLLPVGAPTLPLQHPPSMGPAPWQQRLVFWADPPNRETTPWTRFTALPLQLRDGPRLGSLGPTHGRREVTAGPVHGAVHGAVPGPARTCCPHQGPGKWGGHRRLAGAAGRPGVRGVADALPGLADAPVRPEALVTALCRSPPRFPTGTRTVPSTGFLGGREMGQGRH